MINAVLFDMDGLMVDTERQSDQGWKYACHEQGREMPEWLLNDFKGSTKSSCVEMFNKYFGGKLEYGHTLGLKTQFVKQLQQKEGVPVKLGLFELLDYLQKDSISAVVATSTERATAEKILKDIGAWRYLADVVYGDQVDHGKPAPDIFLLAAQKAGVDPKDCLVLEDSINGIKAGAAAGCSVVHVPDTIAIRPDLLKHLTRAVVPSLAKVPELIDKWNQ